MAFARAVKKVSNPLVQRASAGPKTFNVGMIKSKKKKRQERNSLRKSNRLAKRTARQTTRQKARSLNSGQTALSTGPSTAGRTSLGAGPTLPKRRGVAR